jgi:beta-glucanase (GH16 family)
LAISFAASVAIADTQLIWSDEFDSGTRLDSDVWSYDLGATGWGNQELQQYTASSENVRIENGNLVITVRETDEGFTSARVRTEDKLIFKYGTIEARIKVPDLADGLWPAFWTLGNSFSEVGWPYCGELDIMEMGSSAAIAAGVINQRVGSAAHWDNSGNWASFSRYRDTATDLNDDFHIFTMDWTPDRVTTYIDGEQIWTYHIQIDTCADCSEFHQPHFMILNVAVGGTYTGLLQSEQITAAMPAEMLVDYVRIYDNGHTQIGGSSIYELLGAEYSGSWYSEGQSGHGFSMEFGQGAKGLSKVVGYWYIYDDQGNPIFLVGSGKLDGNRVEMNFQSPVGMQFGVFDPDSVEREDAGTAVFEFSDPDNATFSYTPSEFSINTWGHTVIESLPLVKLFGIPVSNYQATE